MKGTVVNSQNNEPVIYATVGLIKANKGVSTDEKGVFELSYSDVNDSLLVSCVGFKTEYLRMKDFNTTVKLKPIIIELQTVIVKPKKAMEIVLNDFRKRDVSFYESCHAPEGGISQMTQFFECPKEGNWFLKEINLLQMTFFLFIPKEPNKFKLRFYGIDKDGKPDNKDIYEAIIVENKGKKVTNIDLSSKNMLMPKNGLFVAVEWIKIKENMYGEKVTHNIKGEKKRKSIEFHYAPTLAKLEADSTHKTYFTFFYKGWRDGNELFRQAKTHLREYHNMGMSLKISD